MNDESRKEQISDIIPIANVREWQQFDYNFFPNRSAEEISKLRKERMVFSFHFLDLNDELFNGGNTEANWYLQLLYNIKEISNLTRDKFIAQRQHYDVHQLNWRDPDYTRRRFNIVEQTLSQIDPADQVQFRLSSSGGRVHGFFVYNTFYVVWLDPHHNLDIDDRYGGPHYYCAPLTPYRELEMEKNDLQQRYDQLNSEVEKILKDLYDCENENKPTA
jgi:hypothetical protein